LSETKVVRKANMGAKQKLSEKQIGERIKSSQKGKCVWKTKVVERLSEKSNIPQ